MCIKISNIHIIVFSETCFYIIPITVAFQKKWIRSSFNIQSSKLLIPIIHSLPCLIENNYSNITYIGTSQNRYPNISSRLFQTLIYSRLFALKSRVRALFSRHWFDTGPHASLHTQARGFERDGRRFLAPDAPTRRQPAPTVQSFDIAQLR